VHFSAQQQVFFGGQVHLSQVQLFCGQEHFSPHVHFSAQQQVFFGGQVHLSQVQAVPHLQEAAEASEQQPIVN
jgi:hypothetical protein